MKTFSNFKYIAIAIFFIILTLDSESSVAQHIKKQYAVINLTLEDQDMIGKDSVIFNLCKNNINTDWDIDKSSYSFKLNKKHNRLLIPISGKLVYGRIEFINHQFMVIPPLHNGNNLFLFEPNDQVELRIANKTMGCSFAGKNAAKYQCMYAVGNEDVINNQKFNFLSKCQRFDDANESLIFSRDSLYSRKLKIIDKYRKLLSKKICDLISIDGWARSCSIAMGMDLSPNTKYDSTRFFSAKKIFQANYSTLIDLPQFSAQTLSESYRYADYLYEKLFDYVFISKSNFHKYYDYRQITFDDLYNTIKLNSSRGALQDKLELISFDGVDGDQQSDFVNFIDEAINHASEKNFKTALIKFKVGHAIGSNAFKFSFGDANGKIYSLKDFQGKLVVMDFWFTGCKACASLSATLKPIILSFKKNDKIQFISVSIDRKKEMWMSSLKQEIYCDQNELNLLEGMGGNSSFFKFYNVNEYPTILIIDKNSKIISTTPPDPRENKEKFLKLIEQNL